MLYEFTFFRSSSLSQEANVEETINTQKVNKTSNPEVLQNSNEVSNKEAESKSNLRLNLTQTEKGNDLIYQEESIQRLQNQISYNNESNPNDKNKNKKINSETIKHPELPNDKWTIAEYITLIVILIDFGSCIIVWIKLSNDNPQASDPAKDVLIKQNFKYESSKMSEYKESLKK